MYNTGGRTDKLNISLGKYRPIKTYYLTYYLVVRDTCYVRVLLNYTAKTNRFGTRSFPPSATRNGYIFSAGVFTLEYVFSRFFPRSFFHFPPARPAVPVRPSPHHPFAGSRVVCGSASSGISYLKIVKSCTPLQCTRSFRRARASAVHRTGNGHCVFLFETRGGRSRVQRQKEIHSSIVFAATVTRVKKKKTKTNYQAGTFRTRGSLSAP